jgi:DNA-binding NtrC family response regulator
MEKLAMIENLHVPTRSAPALRPAEASARSAAFASMSSSNGLMGESAVMKQLQQQLQQLAATAANVLIYGEIGTGKRMICRVIHELSGDDDAVIATIDCSEGIAAIQQAIARLSSSARGHRPATLIVDGIGDLSPSAQAELVQALEGPRRDGHDGKGRDGRIHDGKGHDGNGHGSVTPRVLAVFEGDAEAALAEGLLNAEAIQRLAPLKLAVPALRERDDDAVLLAEYFLALLNSEEGTSKTLSGDSLVFLRRYPWPGNTRELRSTLQRAFVHADQELQIAKAISKPAALPGTEPSLRIVVGTSLADAEKRMIVATLKKCGGNKTRAAALLGVSLKTLYNRLNGYRAQGLDLSEVDPEFSEVAV